VKANLIKSYNVLGSQMRKICDPLRLIYAIPVFASALSPILGKSRFWVNDDVGNLLVLSGGFSGTLDFKVYVMGPITGLLIVALYQMTTAVPWYPIFLIAIPLLSALLLLKELRSLVPKFAFLGFSLFLIFPMFLVGTMINYTFSSFVGCSLGVTLLMVRICKKGVRLKSLIFPLVLIMISMGLRASWPTGVIGFPPPGFGFASTLGVIVYILVGRSKRELIVLIGLLFSVLLVSLSTQYAFLKFDRDWSDYISYSEARGGLNGTEPFTLLYERADSDDLFLGEVKSKTGIDAFGLEEIEGWHLYDATSVSTDALIALQKLALKEYSNEYGIFDRAMFILREAANFLSFEPLAIYFLFAVLTFTTRFPNRKLVKKIISQCIFIILCGALIVGFVLAGKRTPDYVVAGCLFSLALTLLMLLIIEDGYLKSLTNSDSLAKIVFVSLMAFGSLQTFSGFLRFATSQDLENSAVMRARVRDSSDFLTPVVHEIMTVGLAYENTPFDTSIPHEFFASMDFSGGTFLRSPTSVDRWNRITGESQTVKSLFVSDIYERVLLELGFAESISNTIFERRGKCLAKVSTEYKNFVRLQKVSPVNCALRITQSGTGKSVTDVFSGLSGFDFEVYSKGVSKLEILLISPFGEFAKLHEAHVHFYESVSGKYRDQVVLVDPAVENRIVFNDLKAGDRIEIVSKSPCVIPFELDAGRFADRTEKCVGVESIVADGVSMRTADFFGP